MISSTDSGHAKVSDITANLRIVNSFVVAGTHIIFHIKCMGNHTIRPQTKVNNPEPLKDSTAVTVICFTMTQQSQWAKASSLSRCHDHTQIHHTQ